MILINLWAASTQTHNIEIEWQQSPAQQKTRWRINFARLFSIFIVVDEVHIMDVNLNSIVNSRRSGACERCVHVSGFEAHVKVFSVRLNANEMSWKIRRRSKKLIGAHNLRIFNQFDRNVRFSFENLGNLVIKCDEYINQYAHFVREWADCFFCLSWWFFTLIHDLDFTIENKDFHLSQQNQSRSTMITAPQLSAAYRQRYYLLINKDKEYVTVSIESS